MSSKWLGIALIVSLVLNLMLAGFIIGRITAGPSLFGPDPVLAFPRFARDLPETRREEMRPHVRQHLANLRPNRRAVYLAREEINQAILNDPFDPERLDQALSEMDIAQQQMAKSAQKSFVHFIGALTPAERATFVHRNKRPRHHNNRKPPSANMDKTNSEH